MAYTRPGLTGTLNVHTGARNEQPARAEQAVAAPVPWAVWLEAPAGNRLLNPYTGPTYWLDPAGAPQIGGKPPAD